MIWTGIKPMLLLERGWTVAGSRVKQGLSGRQRMPATY